MENNAAKTIRLDKWLKIARIFKTRSQANHACEERRVKVNGEVAKSAKMIKSGDKITVKAGTHYREMEVLDISFKSISAKEARTLYREEQSQALSEEATELMSIMKNSIRARPLKYPGRPTKKERRNLQKIRGH